MQDRRQSVRDKVLFGGVAEISERGSAMNCVVRNFSDSGVCVEFDRRRQVARTGHAENRAQGPLLSCRADLAAGQQGRASPSSP